MSAFCSSATVSASSSSPSPTDNTIRRCRQEHHHHVSHKGGLRCTRTSPVTRPPRFRSPTTGSACRPRGHHSPRSHPGERNNLHRRFRWYAFPICPHFPSPSLPRSRPTGQTTSRVRDPKSTRHMCRIRHRQPKLLRPHTYILAPSFPPIRCQCLSFPPLTMLS